MDYEAEESKDLKEASKGLKCRAKKKIFEWCVVVYSSTQKVYFARERKEDSGVLETRAAVPSSLKPVIKEVQ